MVGGVGDLIVYILPGTALEDWAGGVGEEQEFVCDHGREQRSMTKGKLQGLSLV